MKAAILTIGDELLNGQTIDSNAAWLGQELNKIGVRVVSKLSVGDNRDDILAGLSYAYQNAEVLIVTGGLGPTKDDITKKVLAEYFNDTLVFNPEAYDSITSYFNRTGRKPTEAHRLQCYLPAKAELIPNNRGTAPGMWYHEGAKMLLSMPGVPSEMKGIMDGEGLRKIASLNPGQHIQHFIIQTAGLGETYIAEQIEDLVAAFPEQLKLAYLPGLGSVKLRITAIGSDPAYLTEQNHKYGNAIVDKLGNAVFATKNTSLSEAIGDLALDKGVTIGTAESCTGGHVARLITSIAGSSSYFKGSVVAYANEVKMNVLNVSENTLEKYGAVSEQTVIEMVQGLIVKIDVDIAVAVSGIAGPGGGSPEKPVGTIWIAVGNREKTITKKLQLVKNRDLNIRYTAVAALNEMRLFLSRL